MNKSTIKKNSLQETLIIHYTPDGFVLGNFPDCFRIKQPGS